MELISSIKLLFFTFKSFKSYFRLEVFCEGMFLARECFLRGNVSCEEMFLANVQSRKKFRWLLVIIVVVNFRKDCSTAKIFLSKFLGIFADIFQHKIIPVCSSLLTTKLTVCNLSANIYKSLKNVELILPLG